MKNLIVSLAFVLTAVLAGCSGSQSLQSASAGDIPIWFGTPPQDPNDMFAAETQTSQDMQLAIDKATEAGRVEIGREIQTHVEALQKRFENETGTGTDSQVLQLFTEVEKSIVSTTLSGSRVIKQKIVRDGNLWRSYVLVEYPVGAANQALMQQIKGNNHLYTRFRASQAFKELQDNVNQYEKSQQQQEQNPQQSPQH